MTDAEIIKALECCCKNNKCDGCPLDYLTFSSQCASELAVKSLDLITRQQAEIERLRKEVNLVSIQFQDLQERYEEAQTEIEQWKEAANKYQKLWCIAIDDIETAQSEAIKEFAEMLNDRIINFPSVYPVENATLYFLNGSSHRQLEILEIIDNLVREYEKEDESNDKQNRRN